jgi:hypothetical protein
VVWAMNSLRHKSYDYAIVTPRLTDLPRAMLFLCQVNSPYG